MFNSICTYGADAVAAKTEILSATHCQFECQVVWPNLAIYWTLGNFLKPLATINLLRSATSLGNFCEGVKICHFSSEIIFGQPLKIFGDFFLVTLNCQVGFPEAYSIKRFRINYGHSVENYIIFPIRSKFGRIRVFVIYGPVLLEAIGGPWRINDLQ